MVQKYKTRDSDWIRLELHNPQSSGTVKYGHDCAGEDQQEFTRRTSRLDSSGSCTDMKTGI
jgi:hypothetical protein